MISSTCYCALVYHLFQMRRVSSIFLILFFSLGPLAGTLQADDESGLPPCCQRHGAHHCTMSMHMTALMSQSTSGGRSIFTAPSTCPSFPGYTAGPTSTIVALAGSPTGLPVLLLQAHTPTHVRTTGLLNQIRTHAGRGPPASNQS